jgi:HEAT repeat protein
LERIEGRLADDKIAMVLEAQAYTFAHAASDAEKANAIKILGLSEQYPIVDTFPGAVQRAGGFENYRRNVITLLTNADPVVRGFSAVWLGALGDKRSTPDLLRLFRSKGLPFGNEQFLEGYDRGRAALALGVLGATEHASDLADALTSAPGNLRAGAALGLGYMKARQHAPAVADLLLDKDDQVVMAAIFALAEMNAKQYSARIATVLPLNRDPAVTESALYALAAMKSEQQTGEIASLLKHEFKSGDAAKALALMGAKAQASAIAELLKDENPLRRCDALLALGILKARDYEDQAAACLDDPQGNVRAYAAWSLVMMESTKRLPEVINLASASENILSVRGKGPAQIAIAQFRKAFDQARTSLARLKSQQ